MIKFVSDLRQIGGFLWVLWFPLGTPVSSTNKADHHDITEILLKVALNTINQPITIMANSDLKRINVEEYTLFIWYSVFNKS